MRRIYQSGCLLMAILLSTISVQAAVPYDTNTRSSDGESTKTQSAYEPYEMIRVDANAPEDIFYEDISDAMYICDTQNGRMLKIQGNEQTIFGEGHLKTPTGVYVRDDLIYVADSTAQKIVVFDAQLEVSKEITRPKEALYGKDTSFVPKKVSVDKRGNIYVIAEGSNNGIIQLNNDGNFLGYVGSNRANVSLDMIIKRLFFTQSQKDQLFKNLPPSPTGITLDTQGLVYSSTFGIDTDPFKKFNAAGNSMLQGKNENTAMNIVDIDVDAQGNMFSIGNDGTIIECDSYGNFLFSFGEQANALEVAGLLKNPIAIDVSDLGDLYVLDKDRSLIQVYTPTNFASLVHEGVSFYKDGRYTQGEAVWQEVLRMNSSFSLSYQALAKSYYKQHRNSEALEAFQMANDKQGYSNAFWEIRNTWLQRNLGSCMAILLGCFIAFTIIKKWDKKKGVLSGVRHVKNKVLSNRYIGEILYVKRFIKHPSDAYYEMRFNKKVTILSASILYGVFICINIIGLYLKGYLFAGTSTDDINLLVEVGSLLLPAFLFIVCNYMVSTINDGEGRFKDVYIGTICAFTPYLFFALPMYALTNILCLNEAFIYDFAMMIIYGYSFILIFIMVKEVHDYSIIKTVKLLLLTLFAAIMVMLLSVCIYVLAQHAFDFVQSLIQEIGVRG